MRTILTDEIWKPIKGFEGLYDISNYGRVMSRRSGKMLKPRKLPNGYLRVHLPNKCREAYIHRLVAETFCERSEGCDVVNHIDNDPSNNHASNLEWTTQRGNVIHAMNQGRVRNFPNAVKIVGVKDGIEYYFRSYNEAAQYAGVDSKTLWYRCKKGKMSNDGFLWKEVS